MKITRKYYDLAKAEMKESISACCRTKDRKTSKEAAGDEVEVQEEMQSYIRKAEGRNGGLPDKQKKAEFKKCCKYALATAKIMEWNLEINTDDKVYFTIEFTAGQFFLVEHMVQEVRKMVGDLFFYADETWIDRKGDLIRILFFFRVSGRTEVEKIF